MQALSIGRNVKRRDRKSNYAFRERSLHAGLGQLTLVEHALCPLASPNGNLTLVHDSRFRYIGSNGQQQLGQARVTAAHGLMPSDEVLLWGLLSIAVQSGSSEIHATPHSILRRLHGLSSHSAHGGRDYRAFRESLRRLSGVKYACDGFYDPVRREHRDVAFGILSYDLPFERQADRAWRIAFDRLFFQYCGVAGGRLFFRWQIYRDLDVASRRLYLFLAKIFCRREWTHWLDARGLAVDVLGFAPTLDIRNVKQKLTRVVRRLTDAGVVDEHTPRDVQALFEKRSKGSYAVRLKRGPLAVLRPPRSVECDKTNVARLGGQTIDRLQQLGLTPRGIERLAVQFAADQIDLWTEITIAAKDQFGDAFFRKGPIPYLRDNLNAAAAQFRVPPDWWRRIELTTEVRIDSRASKRTKGGCSSKEADAQFVQFLRDEANHEFDSLVKQLTADLIQSGRDSMDARRCAIQLATDHWRRRFAARSSSPSKACAQFPAKPSS